MSEVNNFTLEIVTPDGKVVGKDVRYVSAPGSDGEFGVLAGHTEFLTTLKPGEIKFEDEAGDHYLAVSWGYAEVKPESVIILADNAEMAEDIQLERAVKDKANLEEEISKLSEDNDMVPIYMDKLDRANARINVAGRLNKQ